MLGLSDRRAHRDYANANPKAQKEWVETIKKLQQLDWLWRGDPANPLVQSQPAGERIVFFDEFAISDRPSLFYGWAEHNTRPKVKSDERRKRNKLNGMLCVNAVSGEEFFRLSPGSKTEDVSEYLAELCLDCVELGYERLCIILDNNPTHKQKMQSQLALHLKQMGLGKSLMVEYLYLPSYSPKFNWR